MFRARRVSVAVGLAATCVALSACAGSTVEREAMAADAASTVASAQASAGTSAAASPEASPAASEEAVTSPEPSTEPSAQPSVEPSAQESAAEASPEATAPEASGSAEPAKGLFTKDIMICFDNKTDDNITWGFGSKGSSYVVTNKSTTCWPWDGAYVAPSGEYNLSFTTFDGGSRRTGTILATNGSFAWPSVELTYEGDFSEQSGLRADARRTVTLAGRKFGVNRYPDYDLSWWSHCGSNCSRRHDDSVKHLEVVFYPDGPATAEQASPAAS